MGVLTVYLDKIRHLTDEDGVGKSDPYVVFHLEQDNAIFDKNYGRQSSSKKPNDCNPEYGETFTFEDVPSLNKLVLKVSVMDDDVGGDDKIGSCEIDLESLNPDEEGNGVQMVIDPKKGWFSKSAEIFLKISYTE